ncbi:MAG: ATP-dependent 6-phosphofructokinase [Chloroflexaceae bacterium]|nr:ATP-dependent 6-phosphofructokinase [Chloroflexaceae bacterium]
MRIGVLTGGGDVPGLNPCIRAIVYAAEERGWEVIGFKRGWAGPLNFNLDNEAESAEEWTQKLDRISVRTIDRYGGTHLHTSRTNPQKVRPKDLPDFLKDKYPFGDNKIVDCTDHVLKVLDHLNIHTLIPIGGDDTLSYGARLYQEGFRVVACPKTMDNDVFGTDYCMGFGTAVTRSVNLINDLRTPTGSHERIAVVELFGRNSGETALISGYLANVDRVLISEVPFNIERLAQQIVEDRKRNPSNYAMVVVSEGATMVGGGIVEKGEADAYGHRKLGGIGEILGEELKRLTGIDIVSQSLGYLMRAGAPDALDRMIASSYGTMAIQQIEQGHAGLMMAIQNGNYTVVPVDTCIQGTKRVDVPELYDAEEYRPKVSHIQGKPMFLY